MEQKNIDGIKQIQTKHPAMPAAAAKRLIFVDAIRLQATIKTLPKSAPLTVKAYSTTIPVFKSPYVSFNRKAFFHQKVPLIAALALVLIAFTGGAWTALSTPKSQAELQQEPTSAPGMVSLGAAPAGVSAGTSLTNDVLFNTPIELLQSYFAPPPAQDQLAERKAKLAAFLKDRGSPLQAEAGTIAEQDHWKIILAIAFAESTLGEHCKWFNCSGIGGSRLRPYDSLNNWILDFNRLLDKRYKDKTLEQMCGVYVQPCTSNWLMATKQILTALDQQNIN